MNYPSRILAPQQLERTPSHMTLDTTKVYHLVTPSGYAALPLSDKKNLEDYARTILSPDAPIEAVMNSTAFSVGLAKACWMREMVKGTTPDQKEYTHNWVLHYPRDSSEFVVAGDESDEVDSHDFRPGDIVEMSGKYLYLVERDVISHYAKSNPKDERWFMKLRGAGSSAIAQSFPTRDFRRA